jgi:hypothetical protein
MLRKSTKTLLLAMVAVIALSGGITAGNRASAASGPDSTAVSSFQQSAAYTLVDTGQGTCYDNGQAVDCPEEGAAFYGQDAQYAGARPAYTDNGNGTVTDNVTGLMWQQSPDTNGDGMISAADKLSYDQALSGASSFNLAGYTDWRLPTIKELYSLILFDGTDPSGAQAGSTTSVIPFIDTRFFSFAYGDSAAGERTIDSQFASSTIYVSAPNGQEIMFGVNFADGRIKGYGTGPMPGQTQDKGYYVLYVRGNADYGTNAFAANDDGTITDSATGLMWQQSDSGTGMNWSEALAYCEQLDTAGYTDWRLPNVKELQSIVDYSRSPDSTGSAAIDPLFAATAITNEAGQTDYPFYWSSTTHASLSGGGSAAYVAFGRSLGYMNSGWIDVHGAGSQRSDPKAGSAADWPTGHGPQGDAIRIDNYVRCARGGATSDSDGDPGAVRPGMMVTLTALQVGSGPGEPQQAARPGQSGQPPQVGGQPPQGANGRGPAGGTPPQQAIDACIGNSQGATCQFTTPQGMVTGTCSLAGGQMACVPANGPPGAG